MWWRVDRNSIWSVLNGDKVEEIDAQEAREIANRLGIDLPKDVIVDGDASASTEV